MLHSILNSSKNHRIRIVASRRAEISGGACKHHCKLAIKLLIGVLALLPVQDGSQDPRSGRPVTQSRWSVAVPARTEQIALDSYGKLPLAFIPNAGQTDPRVRYHAQAGRASFYFTPREAVFAFNEEDKGLTLRLVFVDCDPLAHIEGSKPGAGRANYLIGSDSARWCTGLPTYGEIIYRDLWPGIDLAFRGENGELKYEFHLAPGANPGNIRLAYEGAEMLSLGPEGELLIHTGFGVLRDSPPVSYQEVAGVRVPVESRYSIAGNSYAIALDAYDPSRPIVIDPGLAYSTYLGGGQGDVGLGIAVDASGSAYVTGETGSSALVDGAIAWSPDGTNIAFSSTRDGNPEIYVINADGAGLVRLTNNRKIDTNPEWSPDGSRIVFSSDRKRSFEIYVMNADGTGLTQITKNGFTDAEAAWSPDGSKIAFSSNRDGNFEVYVMNPDGSSLTRLTNNAAADREPAWSADGQQIIFTSERDSNAEIYVMNADGSGQTRLTTNSAADTSPD